MVVEYDTEELTVRGSVIAFTVRGRVGRAIIQYAPPISTTGYVGSAIVGTATIAA